MEGGGGGWDANQGAIVETQVGDQASRTRENSRGGEKWSDPG